MAFMKMWISRKGALYSCDCSRCGQTSYSHEWVSDTILNTPNEWKADGPMRGEHCPGCGGEFDTDTFRYCGRQYAGRYSADGYMDCTEWSYDPNHRRLARELRYMYGD